MYKVAFKPVIYITMCRDKGCSKGKLNGVSIKTTKGE